MNKIHKYSILLYVVIIGLASLVADAQEVKSIKFSDLESIFDSDEAEVNVINFWATWCKPCIQEMPAFETITKEYGSKGVKVSLISMDFATELERVKKFVKRKALVSDVVLLNEPDYNSWIDKVDPKWSGAIPATLIINTETKERKFYEQSFEPDELKKEIEHFLN